jgi:hypothetical protein
VSADIEALRAALAAGPTPTPWNAAYIAAACNAAPELLAERDALLAALRCINDWCCYAIEENTAARLPALQHIGQAARAALKERT